MFVVWLVCHVRLFGKSISFYCDFWDAMKSKEVKDKEPKTNEITSLQPSSPKKLRSQNITQRLFQRQLGGKRIARQFTSSCINDVFRSLTLRKLLVMHDPENERHKHLSASLKRVSKISEILSVDDMLIVLERSGLCVAFDVSKCFFLFNNKYPSFPCSLTNLFSKKLENNSVTSMLKNMNMSKASSTTSPTKRLSLFLSTQPSLCTK